MFSRPPATPSADPSENWEDNPGIADRFKSPMTADLSSFSTCPTVAEPPNGQVKKHIRFRNRTCPQRKIFFGHLPQMRPETPFDPTRTSHSAESTAHPGTLRAIFVHPGCRPDRRPEQNVEVCCSTLPDHRSLLIFVRSRPARQFSVGTSNSLFLQNKLLIASAAQTVSFITMQNQNFIFFTEEVLRMPNPG